MIEPILTPESDPLCAPESAAALKAERTRLHIKMEAVAREAEISVAYLRDLEETNRNLRLSMFNRIKTALEKLSK